MGYRLTREAAGLAPGGATGAGPGRLDSDRARLGSVASPDGGGSAGGPGPAAATAAAAAAGYAGDGGIGFRPVHSGPGPGGGREDDELDDDALPIRRPGPSRATAATPAQVLHLLMPPLPRPLPLAQLLSLQLPLLLLLRSPTCCLATPPQTTATPATPATPAQVLHCSAAAAALAQVFHLQLTPLAPSCA